MSFASALRAGVPTTLAALTAAASGTFSGWSNAVFGAVDPAIIRHGRMRVTGLYTDSAAGNALKMTAVREDSGTTNDLPFDKVVITGTGGGTFLKSAATMTIGGFGIVTFTWPSGVALSAGAHTVTIFG